MIHRLTVAQESVTRHPVIVTVEVRKGPIWLRPRLKRFVHWLLRKLDAWPQEVYRHTEIKWAEINTERFVESVIKSQHSIRRIWDGDCCLYVGPDAWQDLLKSMRPFGLYCHVKLHVDGQIRVCDIPVTFVPWMQGVLLAPLVKHMRVS